MLKGSGEVLDLAEKAATHIREIEPQLAAIRELHGAEGIEELQSANVVTIRYPVTEYPTKITSFNFDKTEIVEGQLTGIKGQYLLFDRGVINVRKFTGYEIEAEI